MSQATSADDARTETEKTVTVVAYGDDPHLSEREFAQRVDPEGRDYYETEARTRKNTRLVWADEDGEEQSYYVIHEVYDKLVRDSNAFNPDNDAGVEIVRETEEKVTHKHGPIAAARAVRDEAAGAAPDELSGGLERDSHYPRKWKDGRLETRVHITGASVEMMRVLAHQSERGEGAEMFESDEERPALSFTIEMTGDESEVESWSGEMVEPFMTAIGRMNGIGKVRVSDCTEKITKEGDCFGA